MVFQRVKIFNVTLNNMQELKVFVIVILSCKILESDKTYCFPLRIEKTPSRVIVSSNGKHYLTTGNNLKNCYMRQIYARTVRRRLLDDVV